MEQLKKMGKNLGISVGIGIAVLLSLTLLGAWMVENEKLQEELIGTAGAFAAVMAVFASARIMTSLQKEKDLISAFVGGGAMLALLILTKLAAFPGAGERVPMRIGLIAAAILSAALLPRGKRAKRGKRRFVQIERKRTVSP